MESGFFDPIGLVMENFVKLWKRYLYVIVPSQPFSGGIAAKDVCGYIPGRGGLYLIEPL